jgi:hypothetical protein
MVEAELHSHVLFTKYSNPFFYQTPIYRSPDGCQFSLHPLVLMVQIHRDFSKGIYCLHRQEIEPLLVHASSLYQACPLAGITAHVLVPTFV